MIITAGAAGVGLAFYLNQLFNYAPGFNLDPTTGVFLVGLVVGVPMFIYQYYNRILY